MELLESAPNARLSPSFSGRFSLLNPSIVHVSRIQHVSTFSPAAMHFSTVYEFACGAFRTSELEARAY